MRLLFLILALAALACSAPPGAIAADQELRITPVQSGDQSKPDMSRPDQPFHDSRACPCRAMGKTYEMGALVCIQMPEGRKLVRCETVINMPSWTPIAEECDLTLTQ
jgi:hypothetical protein